MTTLRLKSQNLASPCQARSSWYRHSSLPRKTTLEEILLTRVDPAADTIKGNRNIQGFALLTEAFFRSALK